jgi:hypothetical protein
MLSGSGGRLWSSVFRGAGNVSEIRNRYRLSARARVVLFGGFAMMGVLILALRWIPPQGFPSRQQRHLEITHMTDARGAKGR